MGLVTTKTQPYSKQKDSKKYIELPEKKEGETFVEGQVFKIVRDEILYNEKYVYPELFKIIKKDRLFKGDHILRNKLNGDVNKSATIYPLIKSVHDTFVANLYETEVSARAVARHEEDVDQTLAAQSFRDWASNIGHVQDVKELARNEASLLGTSYAIGGVKEFSGLIEYRKKGKNYEEKYEEMLPTMEHISIFDLYYNRNATDFYATQWKAYRKIISWDDCLERYKKWTSLEGETKQEEVKRSGNYVSDKDYKRIYDIKNFEDQFCMDIDSSKIKDINQLIEWMDKNLLCADFSDNQNVEVIEYYSKGNQVVLVNGVVIYDDINILPNKDPFGIVVYERMPGCVRGRGIGHILMAHQEMIDRHQQSVDDMIGMHVNPMYIVERGAIETPSGGTPETIVYKPNKTLENKQPGTPNGGIKPMQWVDFQAVQLAIQHIERLKGEADTMVGTNSYVQGGQTKVERSSTGVNARLGVVRSRLRPITTSLAKLECKMFETWLAAASVLMDEELKIRVMGEDESISWVDIKPGDIINRFDLECSNETNILEAKTQRSQEMMQLIQTIIPNNIDPVTQQPIFDIVDLMQQYVRTFPGNIKVNKFVAPVQQEQVPPEQSLPPQEPSIQPASGWRLPGETDEQLALRLQQTS